MRKNSFEQKIFRYTGLALLLAEIAKQLFLTFAVNGGACSWWDLPWQLCSIPMYVCLAAGFLPAGRIYDACLSFLSTFGLLAGCCAFLDTSGFNLGHPVLTLHSWLYHFAIIAIGIYAGKKRLSHAFLPPLLLFLFAAAVAEILNVSCFNAGLRPINMFYISPKYIFPQMIIKDLVPVIGNNGAILLYICVIIAGAWLLNGAWQILHRRADDGRAGKTSES